MSTSKELLLQQVSRGVSEEPVKASREQPRSAERYRSQQRPSWGKWKPTPSSSAPPSLLQWEVEFPLSYGRREWTQLGDIFTETSQRRRWFIRPAEKKQPRKNLYVSLSGSNGQHPDVFIKLFLKTSLFVQTLFGGFLFNILSVVISKLLQNGWYKRGRLRC